MQKGVLIAEGDAGIRGAMADALGRAGYSCAQAESIQEALDLVERNSFALAVLDVALAGDGRQDLLPLLRARGRLPVIALSPRSGEEGLIRLLNAGVEDYLIKPFEMREFVGRVALQLKRFAGKHPGNVLRHKKLTLDPVTLTVTLCDRMLNLTRQEYKILEMMLSSPPGRVFTKQEFYDYAWSGGYVGVDKTINVHICNIRRKIRAITDEEYIETIWGFGFRLA